jgi:hypothetical protein
VYTTGTADDNDQIPTARDPTIRTEMVIRRLVFLGSGHFGLERSDFILNFGHGEV